MSKKSTLKIFNKSTQSTVGDALKRQIDQKEEIDQLDLSVNTRYVPLRSVNLDSNNSRKLNIGIEDVREGPKISPESDFDDNKQGEYEQLLNSFYSEIDTDRDIKIVQHLKLAIFASTIKSADNLDNPVTVIQDGSQFNLVAGERRTLAHYIFDSKYIQVSIRKFTEYEKAELQFNENDKIESLNLHERLCAVSRLLSEWENNKGDNEKLTRSVAITILGMSRSMTGYFLRLYNAPEDIKNAIEDGSITDLRVAAELAAKSDAERKEKINKIKEAIKKSFKKSNVKIKSNNLLNIGKNTNTKSKALHAIFIAALKTKQFESIRKEALSKYNKNDPKTVSELADIMYEAIKETV